MDVPSGHWGQTEIELARRYGLVDGFGDAAFGPDRPVTREQLSAMLYRAFGKSADSGGEGKSDATADRQPFTDMAPVRWSWAAVAAMQRLGFLNGYPEGTFRPDATMTRTETAVLLLRCEAELEKAAIPESIVPEALAE